MNAVASVSLDREYFDALYQDWTAYRSRWRRFAIPLAIGFAATVAAGLLTFPEHRAIGGGFFVVTVLNLIDALTHRLRWIRQRLASVVVDKTVSLTFTDGGIEISSPSSNGTLTYGAFGLISITPNGIFLVPDSGASIYVPRTSFAEPDEFSEVCSRLTEHVSQKSKDAQGDQIAYCKRW